MENSLISAIFRKLPLKWLLVILAVGGVLFASFSDATTVSNQDVNNLFGFDHYTIAGSVNVREHGGNYNGVVCIIPEHAGSLNDGTLTYNFTAWQSYCTDSDTVIVTMNGSYYIYYIYIGTEFLDVFAPELTSLQCQLKYSLIPVSSVDSNYCTTNNLCPSSSPSDCPNVGVSNLFINDIFHPGAFNIIMNIPEEIDRDYAYTNSGQNFNLDVIGYNQDTEYINGLIDINNYQPTSEDFTNTFLLFKEYGGLLLACLFVILVFYLIKKAFK